MSKLPEKMKIFFIFLLHCQVVWGETPLSTTINIVRKPYDSYINKMENNKNGDLSCSIGTSKLVRALKNTL
jgi:hypothetical protein